MAMLDALMLSRELLGEIDAASAIAAYEAEMFARMQHMTEDTMSNTEMFYAADASDRVVGLVSKFWRSCFGTLPRRSIDAESGCTRRRRHWNELRRALREIETGERQWQFWLIRIRG